MKVETVRLFVAIELPAETRRALVGVMDTLRAKLRSPFRWVAPEALHLTLKFIGETEKNLVPRLAQAVQDAAAETQPFRIHLSGAGVFPGRGSPRVVWAGLDGDTKALSALQTAVEKLLADTGARPEKVPFRPHITIARVTDRLSPKVTAAIQRSLEQVAFSEHDAFVVDSVSLIHSTFTANGPVYKTLDKVPLRQ
ncbi:MAG: RNA 2',3'-cyclic phosphodiesterase [Dehalococcoidia bacterium]